ncbi:DUF6745 domain-containing protein [Actinoallomurus iriomotensis]|uniref:DUF6745 domain-containing protein n=1 Tax=Actinoallomurus iriomotensis TaxID=478107 RepID=A0A9W6RGP8_9ACTN|nr:hypothetical protein [Actinoallomurus iriomotensis]GLY75254.1 hypothetical protein Airi01_035210 [Actinoallomurus iriomotensis]
MIAPARREDAAETVIRVRGKNAHDRWREALKIRQEWLDHGLSTRPADRRTAEAALTAVYARMARPKPRFTWVESPHQAIPLIAGSPTLDQLYAWIRDLRPRGTPPLASDLAMVASQLRGTLSAGVAHLDPELSAARKDKDKPWPELPPLTALDTGVPLGVVLHQGIRTALHRSLATGFREPVLRTLAGGRPVPVCWYGQQDAAWVAYYDTLHRLGLARYGPDALDHLGDWAALARSCGWWWPGEDVCVVVERPELVQTEPVPGTWHDEVRLRRGGVRYRDGWHPLLT